MPSIIDRNLSALRRRQPVFVPPPDDGQVRLTDGVWRLHEDAKAGVAIHSRDPQREADRQAAQLLASGSSDVIVVVGLGLGYLADALERLNWTGKLLAIEPVAETIAPLLARRDWTTWLDADRLRLLVGPDYAGAADCWAWFGDGSVEPPLFVHPVLERIRPADVSAARAVLKRVRFDAASNAQARRKQGGRYLLNTLRNGPAIETHPDVSALIDSAAGLPAIVVAAGPSLDSSLAAVRAVQGRAVIIAVDTALRPLLAGGVHPHAVVAVDPSEANARHLTDLPPSDDTFLVSEGSIDPLAISGFTGRTFFFSVADHHPWPWLRELDAAAGRLRAWGSVLTSAFDLALVIGADPIVLVGADLSYPGDRPYCRGVSFEEDWRRRERWGTPMPQQWREAIDQWPAVVEQDVTGAPVRTAPHLVAFRDWLAEQMRQQSGRRIINAGGAGILKGPGIEQTSPAELSTVLDIEQRGDVSHPFRARYRERQNERVRRASVELLDRIAAGDPPGVVREWQEFAADVTSDAIAHALRAAESGAVPVAVQSPAERAERPEFVETETASLHQVAAGAGLVRFVIPPQRMEVAYSGARMFRFRTAGATIMCCAVRPWQDGMAEDGAPLTRVYDMDLVLPGTYASSGDAFHFRATDGSDPRINGRRYAVLVPPAVAYLESLPLQEILTHDL
jgi:hypothetical protein